MGATKIINVLKDDKFEELLDIVKETDASEVVFVLPKQTRAFKPEEHFVVLADEAKDSDKSVSFLCSNPEVNELAKKYNFDVLSTKTERTRAGAPSRVEPKRPIAIPIAVKADDLDAEEDEGVAEVDEPASVEGYGEAEKEEDYKEAEVEEEETTEEDAPYGTELDESGNPVYDEEEEDLAGRPITSALPPADFQAITASAKTRGMTDVVKSGTGQHVKINQKDKKPVKIETRVKKDDIQSVWGSPAQAGRGSTDNIWSDISKPRMSKKNRGFAFNYKGGIKKSIGILSLVSIVVLALVVYLTTGSARIEIKPKSQELSTQLKITMSPNFSSVDNSFNRIPGQLFTISQSASDEFTSTAEKDAVQKARGIITIYNEYSTSPQPLVATTRFEYLKNGVVSEFVFRTLQSVIVPGMKVENGVITPGRINVDVIADKAGQDYNIPSSDFGVVAWRERGDTARYEKIYGKSADSMRGGILGKAKVVSEFDYNNAKENLAAKVTNNTSEALKKQSAGLELLTNIEPQIDSIESTAKTDDAADTFTMTVNGSITTMGYKKEDLMELIAAHVEKTNGLMIVPDKLELSYKDVTIDPAKNTLEAVVVIGGQAYAKIDQADITANLMGKNEIQIKNYLGSIQNIDSAKVTLSPFWVKKIPRNDKKIDLLLTY